VELALAAGTTTRDQPMLPGHSKLPERSKTRGVGTLVARVTTVAGVVAGLYLLLRSPSLDVQRLRADLAGVGVSAIVVGIVGALGVASLQSLRWWFVTYPVLGIRYRDALAAVLVGNFFNIVLPARAGPRFSVPSSSIFSPTSPDGSPHARWFCSRERRPRGCTGCSSGWLR